MRNITTPTKAVSFEDALRNLAAKLTGTPVASLPRTQEGVVQYTAERIPSVDDLAEAVTKEVMARLSPAVSEEDQEDQDTAPEEPQEPQEPQDTAPEEQASPEAETPAEKPQTAPKTRKRKT